MKPTEDNFDEPEETEDQSKLAITVIVATCVMSLVLGIYFKPGAKPTMTIEMPKPPSIENYESVLTDTVCNLYLLRNDSAALYYHNELIVSTLTDIFSDSTRVRDMVNRMVLIKPHADSGYKVTVDALDMMNIYNLQRYAMVECPKGEFERLKDQFAK